MVLTEKQNNCPYCHSDDPDDNRSIFERDDEYLAIGGTGDVELAALHCSLRLRIV